MRRLGLLLILTALVAAPPAAAKEGVKATLKTTIPLGAEPGTKLDVTWTLWLVDQGRRRPFGAGDVFVRLVSASGEGSRTAFTSGSGDYTATVAVPKGGIGDVQIGLRGFSDASAQPADMLFPITNDPLPGKLRVTSPVSATRATKPATGGSATWIYAVAGGLGLLAIIAAGVVAARRRQARPS